MPPHFEYAGLGFLGQGEKDVLLCSTLGLDIKISDKGKGHPNERHDVDPLFCESGIWHIATLKTGQMIYMPTSWWYQVCCSCLRHVITSTPSPCVLGECVH